MIAYLLSIVRLERSALLYISSFAMIFFAFLGLNGVLYNLFIIKLGFDVAFLGLLTASGQIAWALCALPAGIIGARFGLRGAVIAGYVAFMLGNALILTVPFMPHTSWAAILFVGTIISWVGAPLAAVNGTPYLMAVTSEQNRNKAFTFQAATGALAAFLGSLVAGLLPALLMRADGLALNEAAAFDGVMWLGILAYLVAIVLMVRTLSVPSLVQSTDGTGQARPRVPVKLLLFLGLLFILQLGSEMAVSVFLNVYFAQSLLISTSVIGLLFAASKLLPFLLSPLQPLLLNRWGSGPNLATGALLVALCAVLLAFVPAAAPAAAGFIFFGLVTSFNSTARNLFGQEAVQPRWRTISNAMVIIGTALATGLVGFIGGSFIEKAGYQGLFLSGAIMAGVSVLLYIPWQRRASQKPAMPVPIPLEERVK
jgi:MFS family permease